MSAEIIAEGSLSYPKFRDEPVHFFREDDKWKCMNLLTGEVKNVPDILMPKEVKQAAETLVSQGLPLPTRDECESARCAAAQVPATDYLR